MATTIDQYALETSWSTRITDEIVNRSIEGNIPVPMEMNVRINLNDLNKGKVDSQHLFIKFFSLILREKVGKPVQAIATQFGYMAGIKDAFKAFQWGLLMIKACKDSGLYTLIHQDDEWYVQANFTLDKKTKQEIDKLQYLPPMQVIPKDWTNNHDGGWVWENKHLVLGSKFTKHDGPLAYDVINKLQQIPWEIDAETYLQERQTNRNMNKKKFLRVIDEYLGKPFYFVWRYDSRGRSYSSGYDLNLQNNEYGKALISLYNKEQITNLDNLYIAIANHAGKDKLTWQERIDWVKNEGPHSITEWDEPMLGRKAQRALRDAEAHIPSGYVMSLDATSSGLQIMAAISGCKDTAKWVNCVDPGTRYDVYTEVMALMNDQLTDPIPRKVAKQIVMTHYYNSKATPKALLSEEALEVFYSTIDGLLPGAEEVMQLINDCWDNIASYHMWTLPDGHTAYVPVVTGVNATFTDNELGEIPIRYYEQNTSDNYRSLCPNVIHSIDGYIAREMIRRCNFQLSHVHDCFVFSPDHLQEVQATYRAVMADIARSNILQDILRQLTKDSSLVLTKYSNDLDQTILSSSYMLS